MAAFYLPFIFFACHKTPMSYRKFVAAALVCALPWGCGGSNDDRKIDSRIREMEARILRIELSLQEGALNSPPPQETIQIFLYGYFDNPGRYKLERGITLLAALAVAGSGSEWAGGLTLTRSDGKVWSVDPATSGKVQLQDGDVITALQNPNTFGPRRARAVRGDLP